MLMAMVLPFVSIGLAFAASIKDLFWLRKQRDLEGSQFPALVKECTFTQYKHLARLLIWGALGLATILVVWQRSWTGAISGFALLVGALSGLLAGYLTIFVGTMANSRTTQAIADNDPERGFEIAYLAGGITGKCVVAFSLLGITAIILLCQELELRKAALTGYSFGYSAYALFARVGGGIYTKIADIGADLVGKLVFGLAEDDARNPGKVVDCSGDFVGDGAGIGADIGDSLTAALVSVCLLLIATMPTQYSNWALIICSLGLAATIVGTYLPLEIRRLLKGRLTDKVMMNVGFFVTIVAFTILYYGCICLNRSNHGLFWPSLTATIVAVTIIRLNQVLTGDEGKTVEDVAKTATKGPALLVLKGLAYGLDSPLLPVIVVSISILATWGVAGYFGLAGDLAVSLSALTILSISGILITADVFGPICDTAASFAQEIGQEVREGCDRLDAIGNTTKAATKVMAVCAATMTIIALLYSFTVAASIDIREVHFGKIEVIVSLFLGGVFPFKFSALLLKSVVRGVEELVKEIGSQMERMQKGEQEKPNYLACVDVASIAAFSSLPVPTAFCIVVPIILFATLGIYSLPAFILGNGASSFLLAIFFASSGAIWDNSKKLVEAGFLMLLGPAFVEAHEAAVSGDLVGDAFKDVLAISLETLATVIAIVCLILAGSL